MGLFGNLFKKNNYIKEYANLVYLLESGADSYGMQHYSIESYETVCTKSSISYDESFACMLAGLMYVSGINTAVDYEKAEVYFLNAAKNGNALAYVWLAEIEEKIHANYKKALTYLKKGVKAGDPAAINSLGVAYATATGVTKDIYKAKELWMDALDKGYDAAGLNLKNHMLKGSL